MDINRENILWNNFKEGQPDSFRPLFDYFYSSLCEYAFQILKDKMDAEDVVLDTFIFIWKNLDRINIGKSIRSYLFVSVKNRSLNYLRAVRPLVMEDAFDVPVLDPALVDIDIKDISLIISAALDTVPDRARSIWNMKRENGKTNAQIAQDLKISEKTVEADVTRVRKLLDLTIKRNFIFLFFL